MESEVKERKRQGAVIGGWVCLVLGVALMLWTLLSFLLYLPLFIAAFVLGIVAIAQRRLFNGIPILLLSVAVPLVLGLGLGSYRAHQLAQEIDSGNATVASDTSASPASSTSGVSDASAGLSTKGKQANLEQDYIDNHVKLYDVTAKYMNSVLDGRVPGVTFKIKNDGDRSLDEVGVTIYFKNAKGDVIAEEDYHPVLVSDFNFSGNNDPLKPGYIWQQERGKFYSAKSVPTEWKEGSINAKVTEIEFSKPSADSGKP